MPVKEHTKQISRFNIQGRVCTSHPFLTSQCNITSEFSLVLTNLFRFNSCCVLSAKTQVSLENLKESISLTRKIFVNHSFKFNKQGMVPLSCRKCQWFAEIQAHTNL